MGSFPLLLSTANNVFVLGPRPSLISVSSSILEIALSEMTKTCAALFVSLEHCAFDVLLFRRRMVGSSQDYEEVIRGDFVKNLLTYVEHLRYF